MRLYAHSRHAYQANRYFMEWAEGQWRDVPDDVGAVLLEAHAAKFCDVTGDDRPDEHHCRKTATYMTSQYPAPEQVVIAGEGRVSRQRLDARRQTYKRSRRARVDPAARGA